MINIKYFLLGFKSVKGIDSPALALGASFIAIGALLRNLNFSLEQSLLSTLFTYALPGSLVMAESLLVGASIINIFLAVWLVNARLYPMTVSLFPLLMHEDQPKWKYYISCHFIAVSAWLIMKDKYQTIDKKNRIDFWIGIGTATWSIAIFSTVIGYLASDYLTANMMIGLMIVNPIYFLCMMIGAIKTKAIGLSVILGSTLGPIFYLFSSEWCILFGGLTAGTIAFFLGDNK
tara:strand:+ start:227 stop:925 length:699 start_codon:yes stop_codon:yes gene_type:complete